jgi:hypothetical protein
MKFIISLQSKRLNLLNLKLCSTKLKKNTHNLTNKELILHYEDKTIKNIINRR